ncbi:hypothetical protein LRK24_00270 [Rhodanobacter denitrificans]|jgi:hypothetical protein|uniref:hypothetical protein n=1 Tax=Rhodanobacter denitrificans TaxID=666685 RepID=UPI000260EA55|nr:hypothetical protein [Rhodanobacter denitrificans]EIM03178.1 hypothetical protein UUC_07441 [Rhodanobacter denitrificans]UJM90376.1 hypothetical protein LRK24_00270 [Rhodanobacter denitrificans]
MSMFDRVAKVRAAQLRMRTARHALTTPAAALLVRGRAHPLTTVGAAAGAGFVLGSLGVHPLRVPGLGPLLGGGLAEVVAHGVRLVAELGAMAPGAAAAADAEGGEPA